MAASAADIESHDGQNAGLQTAKDLFSGAVGGIAQVLIGKSLTLPGFASPQLSRACPPHKSRASR